MRPKVNSIPQRASRKTTHTLKKAKAYSSRWQKKRRMVGILDETEIF